MAEAIHAIDPTTDIHMVGVGNLRVMLVHEDGSWFAQGMEIDYAAQGTSLDDAKNNFALGLKLTIREHLKNFGTIEHLLTPAPAEVQKEFTLGAAVRRLRFSLIVMHDLSELKKELDGSQFEFPFGGIEYRVQEAA